MSILVKIDQEMRPWRVLADGHRRKPIFSERERDSLYVIARPSVCRLSSVTFVRPTQAIEIFGNLSTPFGTLASATH